MEAVLKSINKTSPSEFLNLKGIEYFSFEEEFMENNMRCIPMIIRFKMDKAGIKLKLSEWSRFTTEERVMLAKSECNTDEEVKRYSKYLKILVKENTGREATPMQVDKAPLWHNTNSLPQILNDKLDELNWQFSLEQWRNLTDLQRFALLKLCRPGHENRNFPRAIREFKLIN